MRKKHPRVSMARQGGTFTGVLMPPGRSHRDFTHLDIVAPSGRSYGNYPIADPIFTGVPQTIVVEYNEMLGFNFSSALGSSSEVGVQLLDGFMQNIYYRIVQLVQGKRIFPNFVLATQLDFISVLNNICQCYLTLRGLQALLQCGGLNESVMKMVEAAEQNRPQITSQLRFMERFYLPTPLLNYLDSMVGVFQANGQGLVAIAILSNGFTATTAPDLTLANDIATILNANENTMNGIISSSEGATVCELLRLAYGNSILMGDMPVHTSLEEMEYLRTSTFSVWDSTSSKQFTAPVVDTAAGQQQAVPILARYGRSYPDNYLSLLRLPIVASAITASAQKEVCGFVCNTSASGSHIIVYNEAGTANKFTNIIASANNFVSTTDQYAFYLPWAAAAYDELTPATLATSYASELAEWEIVYARISDLADETMVLLEKIFIGGLNVTKR